MENKRSIAELRHPHYDLNSELWEKYRLTYRGGLEFMRRYLQKYSVREDDQEFARRKAISHVPAFAKAALNKYKNAVCQRLSEVQRDGGPKSYQNCAAGLLAGVDKIGSSMNTFIGNNVLPELMSMARVGVYVDMPNIAPTSTIAEHTGIRPYLYWYKAEDIRSWALAEGSQGDPSELTAVLLRDTAYDLDAQWYLPYDITTRYRYLWLADDGYVHAQFYDPTEDPNAPGGYEAGEEFILPIQRIPFVIFELPDSLLADVADYQIGLLNLASTDMAYAIKANHPFYTEQFDWNSAAPYLKPANQTGTLQTSIDPSNSQIFVNQEKVQEIRLGTSSGRRYPKNTERPAFIHPSSEPLAISMEKQAQMKAEIEQLVHLSLSNIAPSRNSAYSKEIDQDDAEAGLSHIATELQHGENRIAEFWAMYEGADPAHVRYPEQFSLLTEEDRKLQAEVLTKLMPIVPSITFRREASKRIARLILGNRIGIESLAQIDSEIDDDPVVLGDPSIIEADVVNGLVDPETASLARGYPPGTAAKAEEAHARRLARIAEHQSKPNLAPSDPGARGVSDQSGESNAATAEKTQSQKDQTQRNEVKKRTRSES